MDLGSAAEEQQKQAVEGEVSNRPSWAIRENAKMDGRNTLQVK